MKKLSKLTLVLGSMLLMLLFVGCSRDGNGGDSSSNGGQSRFHPPAWIQGKWLVVDEYFSVGYKFTSDDVILVNQSTEVSLKNSLSFYNNAGQNTNVEENITSDSYDVIVNYPAGQSQNLSFSKVSNTEIRENNSGAVFTKQ